MVSGDVWGVEALGGAQGGPPLSGVRALEVSETPAGRVAGMPLACLGADVARLVSVPASAAPPADVDSLTWDRGKKLVAAPPRRRHRLPAGPMS
jgi:crotonobetainyl-CoA:carnitine CoA-transferase CaiB-like acyl-CoA transferase